MEVSITDITDIQKEIHIQATANELIPHFERAYKQYQPKVEIRGFRKGKAPLDLVKKIHGESIEYNALDTVASDLYRQIVEERDIQPIGEPVLTDINYRRGEELTFKIKYEIKPKFSLNEYKGISVERVVHTVTEKELEEEILRLRKSNSTLQDVDDAVNEDHIITADVQQLDDTGSPLIGKKTSDTRLYLSDENLFSEIKTSLLHTKVGETRRTRVEHDHDGQKRTDHLDITVKKIERVILPDLSDDFIKKITKDKVTGVEEFRKQLRTDLEGYWKERSERKLTDAIIAEIVKRHEIAAPESLIKGVLDSLLEEMKNRYPNKKLPADFDEKTFRESNRGYAIFQAQWYLVRERIIDAEGITVDDSDFDRMAETDAPRVGIDKERLLQFYKTSGSVKERILSEKLLSFLFQHEQITERVTEEPID